MTSSESHLRRTLFREFIVRTFWDTYDHLGRIIFLNLLALFGIWLLQILAIYFIPKVIESDQDRVFYSAIHIGYSMVTTGLFMLFWSAGLVSFMRLVSAGKEPDSKLFFRSCLRPSLANLLFWFITPLIVAYVVFSHFAFSSIFRGTTGGDFIYAFCLGVSFWTSVVIIIRLFMGIWLKAMNYELNLKESMFLIVRYSRLFMSWILFMGIILFLMYISRGAILVILGFVIPFISFNALMQVIRERETFLFFQNQSGEKAEATSWKEKSEQQDLQNSVELYHDRYNRGFRDILKPWGDNLD